MHIDIHNYFLQIFNVFEIICYNFKVAIVANKFGVKNIMKLVNDGERAARRVKREEHL